MRVDGCCCAPLWRLAVVVLCGLCFASASLPADPSVLGVEPSRFEDAVVRGLAIGDFQELNDLIRNAVVILPNTESTSLFLDLYLTNIRCTNFQVGDIIVRHTVQSKQTLTVQVDINQLDTVCTTDYEYYTFLFFGSGTAQITSSGNEALTSTVFSSPNFDYYAPLSSTLQSCQPVISLDDVVFEGGGLSIIPEGVEGLLRGLVARQAERVLCEVLTSLSTTRLVEILRRNRAILADFTGGPPVDPIAPERELERKRHPKLLSMTERETSTGKWFQVALEEVVSYLSAEVDDPDATRLSGKDMRLNVLLRQFLDDRAFVVDMSDLPIENGGVLYQGHDQLTETTITLDAVRLLGLDTFTMFKPVYAIGNLTLQTELSWDRLGFEFTLVIDIKPSTKEDSIISNPGSTNVVETVKVSFGFENLEGVASLLLAIDQDSLESLELGALMSGQRSIVACMLSTIFDVEFSNLSVEVGNVQPPTLDGFVSTGIDRVVTRAVDAAFAMYEGALLRAAPGFFQSAVKSIVNSQIANITATYGAIEDCVALEVPPAEFSGGFVDLRDLLLPAEESTSVGGSGLEPYGDLISNVVPIVEERLLSNGDDGTPKINGMLRPVTESQSGVVGTLTFPNEFLNFTRHDIWEPLVEKFAISLSHFTLENVDTLSQPLSLVRPTNSTILSNRMNFGPVEEHPLSGTVRLGFAVEGNESPLSMRNLVDVKMSVPSSAVSLDYLVQIKEKELLRFPLRDLSNIHCWLAAIPVPEVDVFGNLLDEPRGVQLTSVVAALSQTKFDVRCVSCTSPGGEALSEIMTALEDTQLVAKLEDRIDRVIEDLLLGYWEGLDVHTLLSSAPRQCPHSPYFVEGETENYFKLPGFPTLSKDSLETLVIIGALLAECSLIVVSKSHLLLPSKPRDPLSSQFALVVPEYARLLDWTDLGSSVGSWAESVLEETREYLRSNATSDGDLKANTLVREKLLDEEGRMTVAIDGVSFESQGFMASIDRFHVMGLDSLSEIEVLLPISPQTLQHRLRFQNITFVVEAKIRAEGSEEILRVVYSLEDVAILLTTFVAIDLEPLGDIKMGSVLDLDNVLPCLFSRFYDFDLPQLFVTADRVVDPVIQGFVDPEFLSDASESLTELFDRFRSDLKAAIPKVFDITVREVFNAMLEVYRKGERQVCQYAPGTPSSEFIDFRDLLLSPEGSKEFGGGGLSPYGDAFQTVFDLFNSKVGDFNASNTSSINDLLITPLTESQSNSSGMVEYAGIVLNTNGTIQLAGLNARMRFVVSDAKMENLDTVGKPLDLLQPVRDSPNTLRNSVGVGVGGRPLKLKAKVLIEVSDDADFNLHNEVEVALVIGSFRLFVDFLLKISQSSFFDFPVRDVPDYKCWLATIPKPSLLGDSGDQLESRSISMTQYSASADEIFVNVSCVDCSSPDFDKLVSELYSPGTSQQDIDQFFTKAFDYIDKVLGSDFLQNFLDQVIADATKQCPHNPEYDPDASFGDYLGEPSNLFGFEKSSRDKRMALFNIANGAVAGALILCILVAKWLVSRSNKVWRASLSKFDAATLAEIEENARREEAALDETTPSLFRSPHIPAYIRYGAPLVVILNIGLYLGGHWGLLSYIDLGGQFAGEPFSVHRFIEFSFFDAAMKTYRNGGNEMAIFLIVFSGIWPYMKLLTSLFLWFVPPRKVSTSLRGSLFLWMDVLTKLSVIDVFMMLLVVAAILVYVGGPDNGLVDVSEYYSLKLLVVPSGGFYSIMMAQRLSRVSSRFFLDYHKKIIGIARKEFERKSVGRSGSTAELTLDTTGSAMSLQSERSFFPSRGSSNSLALVIFGEERDIEEDVMVDDRGNVRNEDREVPSIFGGTNQRRTGGVVKVRTLDVDELSTIHGSNDPRQDGRTAWYSQGELEQRFGARFKCLRGSVAVTLAAVTILILLIIGFILAPSSSLEVNRAIGIALESGNTFAQAVERFNVFRVVCLVLLETRVVLQSTEDYVGLGILLGLIILTALGFTIMQIYNFVVRILDHLNHRKHECLDAKQETCTINRLKAWEHMEVYIIAFVFASWQLGAITAYVIHNYCDILKNLYDALSYIGLLEATNANCFASQASAPTTLGILIGSFSILFVSFLVQAITQFKENKASAEARLTDSGWVVGKK